MSSTLDIPLRYWHTLRWLRPVQVLGRAWFKAYRPRIDQSLAPPVRQGLRTGWIPCGRPASMLGPRQFRFLGVTRDLVTAEDWNRVEWPKLWLYNLHYFDDLVADGAGGREDWHRDLVARWIAQNRPGTGNGWEPYPTSLRIVNWTKWGLTDPSRFSSEMLHSVAVQARWLTGRLEHHLLGNHLWANAKALVFAGALFEGSEARDWLQRGLGLLERELREQVLADGGHFERSPMYHAMVLEDLLDLIQLADRVGSAIPSVLASRWRESAEHMGRWLAAMSHPDGAIAFFNDAAIGIAPPVKALADYAKAIGVPAPDWPPPRRARLAATGFERIQVGDAVLLADVGSVGPDYLPGHAHAETLSFELSVAGRRQLVNSGISTYAAGTERLRQRGTASHNTVVVDGKDSSEVWGSFRVARRARAFDVVSVDEGSDATLIASHDGYRRLAGRVTHRRQWRLSTNGLTVTDLLMGRFESAQVRFHFAPGETLAWSVEGGEGAVERATWHPRFGESVPTKVLVVRFSGPECRVTFRWA